MESLERLRDLYEDLLAFSETRLANVDRLLLELESSVQEFRMLLDKPAKSNVSRQSLSSGVVSHPGLKSFCQGSILIFALECRQDHD
jgi:nuclear pore complex protein Nup205